ncbi:MAG: hypothetical protein ACRDHO_02060 [Actinomycetota bacterium]
MGNRRTVGAFSAYLAASVVLFGLPALSDFNGTFIGPPAHPDPRFFFWALSWWPHALIDGLNPIWTYAVWAPAGYNLAWATGVPGPSLLMFPITVTAGPVVSYNVLAILSPALSGLAAFVLCRHVTGKFWPSLLGGYLFGFSTYQLGHLGLHINLELVFLMPLVVFLVVLRAEDAISPRRFVILLTLALIFQFLTSTELFATLVVFGGLALGLAIILWPGETRARMLDTAKLTGLSLCLTAVVVSPYLWYAFAHGVPRRRLDGSDLLSFFVPRLRTLIGAETFFSWTREFPGTSVENTAYLGLPLIGILGAFAITQWRRRLTKLLIASFLLVALAALGRTLYVNGRPTIALPWRAIEKLPVINNAAPRRFTVYLFLISAVVVAMWLASGRRAWTRWAVALLAVLFLFPKFSPDYLHGRADIPVFFASGEYRRHIGPGENILILPSESPSGLPQAMSMVIQARTDFSFRLAMAYTGPPPPDFEGSRIEQALYQGKFPAVGSAEFRRFLAAHEVRTIVLDQGSVLEPAITAILEAAPTRVDDVLIYQIQPP